MNSERKRSKTALITGASGGIGEALARIFAEKGFNLVLVARSEDKLKHLQSELERQHRISALVIVKDLSLPHSPPEIFAQTEAEGIQVDVLVNNAGYTAFGPFVEGDLNAQLAMMQVNMGALTHLTGLYLPGMVKERRGKILNLASTAAFQPGPLMAVYYATKAFVLFFSEALAEELRGSGVTVTALCPGPTRSGFQSRGSMEESRLVQGEIMDVDTVAKAGYRALMKGQTVAVPGPVNRMFVFSMRLVPRRLATRLVRRLQEPVSRRAR